MRKFRASDVSFGIIAVLVNIALVAGVVWLTTGRSDTQVAPLPSTTSTKSATTTTVAITTPVPTASTVRAPVPGTLTSVLGAPHPVTISVLGDDTGDEPGEWPSVLAEYVGLTHATTLSDLDPADPTQYAKSRTFGTSGPKATIWNGSRRGATAGYGTQRLQFLMPAAPDVVLLSYGRNNTAKNVGAELAKTVAVIRAKHPKAVIAAIVQPPDRQDTQAGVRTSTIAWAKAAKIPTIDVAAAFARSGDVSALISTVDPISVNAAGGRLWAQTVFTALGGIIPARPAAPTTPDAQATGTRNPASTYTPPAYTPPAYTRPPYTPPADTPPATTSPDGGSTSSSEQTTTSSATTEQDTLAPAPTAAD